MDEMIIGIFSIVVFIVSIVIVLWIRAIYLNSEKIKNLLYVQTKLLEKDAESKGIDIDKLYKEADSITTYSIKKKGKN
jgi:hypothetical protein